MGALGLLISINGADFRPYDEVRVRAPSVQAKKPTDAISPVDRQLDHPDSFEKLLEKVQNKDPQHPYQQAKQEQRLKTRPRHAVHAKDLMTSPVIHILETKTVEAAKQLLQSHSFRHLPVINAETGLVGMVSDRSFFHASNDRPVSEVMSRDLMIAEPNTLLQDIIKGMLELKVHSVPVLDSEKQLIGIVTSSDLLKSLLKNPNLDLWA